MFSNTPYVHLNVHINIHLNVVLNLIHKDEGFLPSFRVSQLFPCVTTFKRCDWLSVDGS